ncbi:MAG: NAD(P)/FAD-dependent oxidoreductase [Salinirussus sp.]
MKTHVAVIGAYGSAGIAAVGELAGYEDIDLTLVDGGRPGGLCILRGCMPSKEVLSAGAHRFGARHDHRVEGTPEVDLEAVVETKDEHVADFASHRASLIDTCVERDDATLVEGSAEFVDDTTLEVDGQRIDADYVVVATGSSINVPDTPGIEDVDYMTSADVLDATTFPDTGIVMGFGYIGMEMAPYLAEAGGMELTVIEHDDRPLDEADSAFGDAALEIYREEFGLDIRTDTHERRLEPAGGGNGVRLELDDGDVIEADQLFCFTGRRPNVDGLSLSAAGLAPEPGWVEETMQARDNDRVFVVGDANGKEPILHVAKEQGMTAAHNIVADVAGEELTEYENVHHHVMFSGLGVYPFARVGHSETSAREAGHDPVVATREAASDGVFRTKAVPEGLARLVVARDGTVLGYQGLHYHADVMAKTMQIAVEMELDVRRIPDRAYHPTTPEILDSMIGEATEELDPHPGRIEERM